MDQVIERIRAQAESESIRLTLHAHQEMVEEDYNLDDLLDALRACTLLEDYPEDRRGPACLLLAILRPDGQFTSSARQSSPADHHHGLRAEAAQVEVPDAAEALPMRCSIQGCSGELERRAITHTVRHKGRLVVIDHVPAEVCGVCGEVLLAPEAVRRIEEILETQPSPSRSVPLYEYA